MIKKELCKKIADAFGIPSDFIDKGKMYHAAAFKKIEYAAEKNYCYESGLLSRYIFGTNCFVKVMPDESGLYLEELFLSEDVTEDNVAHLFREIAFQNYLVKEMFPKAG